MGLTIVLVSDKTYEKYLIPIISSIISNTPNCIDLIHIHLVNNPETKNKIVELFPNQNFTFSVSIKTLDNKKIICGKSKPIIGKDNLIDDNVVIEDNVRIGNNNVIKKGTVIYANTVIGDFNIIEENNRLGTLPALSNLDYHDTKRNGLIIGNHNFFHINNLISSGSDNQTIIGNHNKFLSDVYISHDNIIHDHVTFYPRVFSAGLVEFFDHSNLGAGCHIQQRCKIGAFSMVGMNGVATRNVLPFMICINNKYLRPNKRQFHHLNLSQDEEELLYQQLINLIPANSTSKDMTLRSVSELSFGFEYFKSILSK